MSVGIRSWTLGDAPKLAAILDNPAIQANLRDGLPLPYTAADAEEYIRFVLANPDTQYVYAIEFEGDIAGCLGIHRQDNIHRLTAELGYYIAQPLWGRGITATAVRLACEAVFSQTDILRIFADPFAYNIASCRVLEKAGFSFEGTLRKNCIKNGVVHDMQMYALVRE